MARTFKMTNTTPQTKYMTSDGRSHDNPNKAREEQFQLDFELWYSDPENQIKNTNAGAVRRWFQDHATDICKMLDGLGGVG